MTSVVRIRRKNGIIIQDCDLYIGRRMSQGGWNLPQSKWANPFKISDECSRAESLKKFEAYVRSRSDLMNSLHELEGKRLGCWCVYSVEKDVREEMCHGQVLIRLLKEQCRH